MRLQTSWLYSPHGNRLVWAADSKKKKKKKGPAAWLMVSKGKASALGKLSPRIQLSHTLILQLKSKNTNSQGREKKKKLAKKSQWIGRSYQVQTAKTKRAKHLKSKKAWRAGIRGQKHVNEQKCKELSSWGGKDKIHAAEQTLAYNKTTKTGLTRRIKKEGWGGLRRGEKKTYWTYIFSKQKQHNLGVQQLLLFNFGNY